MAKRKKLSTTISAESYALLERLVKSGKAESLAQALDNVLDELRRRENRRRLERATAAAYENMTPGEIEEESGLGEAFSATAGEINLDE